MRKYIDSRPLRCFLACLLVLTIISGTWFITQLSATPVYADDSESKSSDVKDKIKLYKDLAEEGYNSETGIARIRLEAYATGNKIITEHTDYVPSDIVLVLDVSLSMNDPFGYKYVSQTISNSSLYSGNKNNDYYTLDNYGKYCLITGITRNKDSDRDDTIYTYTYIDSDGNTKTKTSTGKTLKPSFIYALSKDTNLSTTKLEALKSSALGFVKSVEEKSSESCKNRIAVVSFGSTAAYVTGDNENNALKNMYDDPETGTRSKAEEVKTAISDITAKGATNPETGLKLAKAIFEANDNQDEHRNRVVVFFTDGTPGNTENKWESTSTTYAQNAVSVSNTLTKDYGATVYAVGIFHGSDGDSSGIAYTNSSKPSVVAACGNYFMQHVSANGTLPESGISGYYFSADNSTSLNGIFQEIYNHIDEETSGGTSIDERTEITDNVSDYFTMPEGIDGKIDANVAIYTAECIGENKWADRIQFNNSDVEPSVYRNEDYPDEEIKVSVDENGIKVTGFNYGENWVGEITKNGKSSGYHGRKLIIEFDEKVAPDYLGGSGTLTNGDGSGIKVNVEGEDPIFKEFTEEPTVDVLIKTITPSLENVADEWNIYLSTEKEISKKLEELTFTIDGKNVGFDTMFNGTNNADVNVSFVLKKQGEAINTFTIPKGKTAGSWAIDTFTLSDGEYTIECIVEDAGDVDDEQKFESKTATADVKINVFKPVLTFTDMTVDYGATLDLDNVEPTVEWKHGDTLDQNVTMHTSKPELTYTYSGATAGAIVNQTDDYNVKVETVTANGVDLLTIDNAVTFLRTCEKDGLSGATSNNNPAFVIHVINTPVDTVTLTIKKEVTGNFGDKTRKFDFEVTIVTQNQLDGYIEIKEDGEVVGYSKTQTVKIKHGETEILPDLPKGAKFTIKEIDVPNAYKVYFNDSETESTNKTFEGTLSDDETTVKVTNKLEKAPETGIDDGNLPLAYGIVLFSVSGLLALRIFARRRDN